MPSQPIFAFTSKRRSSNYQFHSFWVDQTVVRTHDLLHSRRSR